MIYKCLVGMVLLCSLATDLYAFNTRFLEHSTLGQLTKTELSALTKAVQEFLDKAADHEVAKWYSKESKLSVKVMVQFSFEDEGQPCRRMRFKFYDNETEKDYYSFDICKTHQKWAINTTTITKDLTKQDKEMISKTLNRALSGDEEGTPFSWFNANSKHSGVVVPGHSFSHDSKPCKSAAITVLNQEGHTAEGKYTFCKQGSKWERAFF